MHAQAEWLSWIWSRRRHRPSDFCDLSFILQVNIWTLVHLGVSKVVRIGIRAQRRHIIWMSCFSHDCIFVMNKSLMNILKSFLALCCNFSVRLRADFINMFLGVAHVSISFEHFNASRIDRKVEATNWHIVCFSHVAYMRRASVIDHRFASTPSNHILHHCQSTGSIFKVKNKHKRL